MVERIIYESIEGKRGVRIERDDGDYLALLWMRNGYQWQGGGLDRDVLLRIHAAIESALPDAFAADKGTPLTGAQPAPAAPNDESVEALAHRMAWRYSHGSSNPNDLANSTYTFNRATLLDFAATLLTPRALVALAAPAAQPADSAMEVLRDWLDALDRSDYRAQWSIVDRARALTAASKERSKTHE